MLERFGCALHICTGFFQLFARVGHARLVLRLFHALLQIIDVGQHLAFFFAQAFETLAKFFLFRFGFGFLQGQLQFFDAFVQILLPLR